LHVTEVHQDRGGLAAPLTARVYEGRVARVHPDGDPLQYVWGPEYRDSDGLAEIVKELQTSRPFTLLHPEDLISKGAKADVIGQVIGARIDGDAVVARILVTDPRGVTAIAEGIHELSLGYTSRLDDRKRQREIRVDHLALVPKARCGVTCALRTDCQGVCTCNTNAVRYNTSQMADAPSTDSALTAAARHELPSHMFAASESQSLPLEDETHVQNAMSRFNQTDFKGPSERKAAFHHIIARAHQLGMDPAGFEKKHGAKLDQGIHMEELQKKLGEALATAAAEKARADQLDIELKAARATVTAAEINATNAQAALASERKATETANAALEQARRDAEGLVAQAKLDAKNVMASAVAARVQLLTEATQILGSKDDKGNVIDRSSMDDQAIRLAVIKHVDNLEFPPDRDPVFVQGVYAGSVARAAAATASRSAAREGVQVSRATAARVTQPVNAARTAELAAQKAMMDDQAKRWRAKSN
jgi:hypothetical protein